MSKRVVVALVAASVGLGCQLVLDLGDKVYALPDGGSADATDGGVVSADAGIDGAEAGGPIVCPNGKGPPMVNVGSNCIDATEVTGAQYRAFLTATGGGIDVAGQPPQCSWNTTFEPTSDCDPDLDGGTFACTGSDCDALPQACVDWCDAFAYCKWAGKRMCGSPAAGPASLASLSDPATSAWTAACTSGGKHLFPYGDSYVAGACGDDGDPNFQRHPKKVGSYPDCQSKEPGWKGVLDLSGNVGEWEDACIADVGANDRCRIRGGSAGSAESVRCDRLDTPMRDSARVEIGIRCCAP